MTFHDLILRLRALVTPGKIERELSDELEFVAAFFPARRAARIDPIAALRAD